MIIPFCTLDIKIPNMLKYLKDELVTNKPHKPSFKEIRKFRKIFNIPFIMEPVLQDEVGWDGFLLRVGDLRVDDVLHEISHYIVAAKYRRKLKDFGLGSGFNSLGSAPKVVSSKFAYDEEELVCVLQWILMYNLGYGKYISYTMQDQNWNNQELDRKKIKKHLKTIYENYSSGN